jgi:hypothetical protein
VGELLAERGAVVLCGGGGGVMAAAAAGARSRGGLAVGVLPGGGRTGYAVAEVDVSIVTDLGEARNSVIISSADAVIAVGGSWGTLSEIALALRRGGIPVVTVGGWQISDQKDRPLPGPVAAADAEQAVTLALDGEAAGQPAATADPRGGAAGDPGGGTAGDLFGGAAGDPFGGAAGPARCRWRPASVTGVPEASRPDVNGGRMRGSPEEGSRT